MSPQMDSSEPAGTQAGRGRRPEPTPLPVRKPSAEQTGAPTGAATPDEAQRANFVRALRATRRAAFGPPDAPAPAAPPAGAEGAPPAHGDAPEEGETSSRFPRPRILVAAVAGLVLIAGAILLPGLGEDGTPSTVSSADRATARPGTTSLEVAPSRAAPSDGAAKKSAEHAQETEKEKEKDGRAGDAPAGGTESGQEEKGKSGGVAEAPEDDGKTVAEAAGADANTSGETASTDRETVAAAGRTLIGRQSGKCLSGGGTRAQLTIRTCDGAADQLWEFRPDGTIRSRGLCVDLAGASKDNGTAVQMAGCTGAAAQQFHLNSTEDLVARFAAKCVDVYDSRSADGTLVILWPCTGAANQTWTRH